MAASPRCWWKCPEDRRPDDICDFILIERKSVCAIDTMSFSQHGIVRSASGDHRLDLTFDGHDGASAVEGLSLDLLAEHPPLVAYLVGGVAPLELAGTFLLKCFDDQGGIGMSEPDLPPDDGSAEFTGEAIE